MIWVRYLVRNPRLSLGQYRTFTTGGTKIVNVRPVRIKRPWLRRFASSILVYGAAAHLWSSLVFTQLDGSTLSESTSAPGVLSEGRIIDGEKTTVGADDDEENVTFIPLSWPRLRPGELYSGRDPEWETFKKISKDKKRLDLLKDEIKERVCKALSRSPDVIRLLGKPVKVNGSWLMVHFPYRAPPHYETIGLEISDDDLVIVSKTIPPEQGHVISAAIFPYAVMSSMYTALTVLSKTKLRRMKSYLGIDEQPTENAIMSINKLDLQSDLKTSTNVNLQGFSEWEKSISKALEKTNSSVAVNDETTKSQGHTSRVPKVISLMQDFSTEFRTSDYYFAYLIFRLHLMKNKKHQPKPIPPRGSFYVSGPVGIEGSKGLLRVNVRAVYDPAKAEWSSMDLVAQDLQQFAQQPLG